MINRYSCGVEGGPYSSRMPSMTSSRTTPSGGRVLRGAGGPATSSSTLTAGEGADGRFRRLRRRPAAWAERWPGWPPAAPSAGWDAPPGWPPGRWPRLLRRLLPPRDISSPSGL